MASTISADSTLPDGVVRTGFWSGETLTARYKDLIKSDEAAQVEYASIRLRIGEEVYITPTGRGDGQQRTKQRLKAREGFEIPPGQLAFLTTEEKVTVPGNAMAFISLRSKQTKFAGLINVSGFHVDPGYSGKLIFVVFNAGPSSIHAARGDEWFVIFFTDLDRAASDMTRTDGGHNGIESQLITPVSSEFLTFKGLDTKIDETKGKLEERLRAVERDNALIRWGSAAILGFLLTFAARSCVQDDQQRMTPPVERAQPAANQDALVGG